MKVWISSWSVLCFVGGFLQVFPQRKTAKPRVLDEDGTVRSSRSGFSWSNLSLSTLMILGFLFLSHNTPAFCFLSYGKTSKQLWSLAFCTCFFQVHACNYSKQSFMLIVHSSHGLQEERIEVGVLCISNMVLFILLNCFCHLFLCKSC